MQPLHWGFFVRWDGEKPVESPDASPVESPDASPSRRSWCPWNFSPYLHIVYHKAL